MQMNINDDYDDKKKEYCFEGFETIDTKDYQTVDPKYISIICISDSHSNYKGLYHLPRADLLIHSGDFSFKCSEHELDLFCRFLKNLDHIRYKVVIAGNHEFQLDYSSYCTFE